MPCDAKGQMCPIEFVSRVWSPSESRNWPTSTKELAAMMKVCEKWERYLGYRTVYIHGDAKNVEWLMKRIENRGKKTNKMHYHMAYKLHPFQYEVTHIPGVQNIVADYLSRYNRFMSVAIQLMNDHRMHTNVGDGFESGSDEENVRLAGSEQIVAETGFEMDTNQIRLRNDYQRNLKDSNSRVFASYDESAIKTETEKGFSKTFSKPRPCEQVFLLHNNDYKYEKCVVLNESITDSLCVVKTSAKNEVRAVLKTNVYDFDDKLQGRLYLLRNREGGDNPHIRLSQKIKFQKRLRQSPMNIYRNDYLQEFNNQKLFYLSQHIREREESPFIITNKSNSRLYINRHRLLLRRSARIKNKSNRKRDPNDLSLRNVNKNSKLPTYLIDKELAELDDNASVSPIHFEQVSNLINPMNASNNPQQRNEEIANDNNVLNTDYLQDIMNNDIEYGIAYEYELLADHIGIIRI